MQAYQDNIRIEIFIIDSPNCTNTHKNVRLSKRKKLLNLPNYENKHTETVGLSKRYRSTVGINKSFTKLKVIDIDIYGN